MVFFSLSSFSSFAFLLQSTWISMQSLLLCSTLHYIHCYFANGFVGFFCFFLHFRLCVHRDALKLFFLLFSILARVFCHHLAHIHFCRVKYHHIAKTIQQVYVLLILLSNSYVQPSGWYLYMVCIAVVVASIAFSSHLIESTYIGMRAMFDGNFLSGTYIIR